MENSILKHLFHRIQKPRVSQSIIGTKQRAYGIDLSRYEPNFVPENATPGLIDFGIIKATQGISIRDAAFDILYPQVSKLAIDGAYHYLKSQVGGRAQADYFVGNIGTKQFDILAIDFEGYGNVLNDNFVRVLFDALVRTTELKPDCKIVLYTNPNLYDTVIYPAAIRIWGRDVFLAWDLWIAQYYWIVNPDGEPFIRKRNNWKIWQISDAGRPEEHGTTAYVDRNVFNGTKQEMLEWVGRVAELPPTGDTMETWKCKINGLAYRSGNGATYPQIDTLNLGDIVEGVLSGWIHGSKITRENGDVIIKDGWCSSSSTYMERVIIPPPTTTLPDLKVTIEAVGYPTTITIVHPNA